jgi:lambda repressor-like predicted transcriptional regulator
MTATETRNTYLDQVVAQQQQLEQDLQKRAAPAPYAARSRRPLAEAVAPSEAPGAPVAFKADADGFAGDVWAPPPVASGPSTAAVDVHITGIGRWKTVLVPPNAFVVHTRRDHEEPMHVGLGVSFRFNPATDTFLVVPGAMQTILINAYCICRELQGLLVQAYVQWIIEDFSIAYQKLDFSDPVEPMRLVNLQLKEQAEATIKDKVATMSVHEVLSDKQPIIEELTARLRAVAEGEGDRDTGLGLRIVTVQIKEAVVSSSRLWENLQKPYRAEQQQIARVAELAAQDIIAERELTADRVARTQRMQAERDLAGLRARIEAQTFDQEAAERIRRTEREQEDARRLADLDSETRAHVLALERALHEQQEEIDRLRIERDFAAKRLTLDNELALERSRVQAGHDEELLRLERTRLQADIDNGQSPANLQAQLVASLPEIVERLPKPTEVRTVNVGAGDGTSLAGIIAQLGGAVAALQAALSRSPQ